MSAAKDVKDDRKYTKEHEWARRDGDAVVVGITAFAVDQLGDITLVSLDVKPGDTIQAGKSFGTIESVKTLSDLYAPISGKIVSVNATLDDKPELINDDCWSAGWMVSIEPSRWAAEEPELLDASSYSAHLASSEH
jgi:glycine cleavage system H protein